MLPREELVACACRRVVGLPKKEEGRDGGEFTAKEEAVVGCAGGHASVKVSRWVAVVGELAWLQEVEGGVHGLEEEGCRAV